MNPVIFEVASGQLKNEAVDEGFSKNIAQRELSDLCTDVSAVSPNVFRSFIATQDGVLFDTFLVQNFTFILIFQEKKMVILHIKKGDESQFLYETRCQAKLSDLIPELIEIYNGRLKIERLNYGKFYCSFIKNYLPSKLFAIVFN